MDKGVQCAIYQKVNNNITATHDGTYLGGMDPSIPKKKIIRNSHGVSLFREEFCAHHTQNQYRYTPQWEENSLPIRLYQKMLLVDVVCTWVKMSKLDMMRKIQTYYWQFLKLTRKWGRPHWLPIGFRLVSIKRRVREVRALTVPSWVPGVYVPNTLLLLAVTCFAHFNLPAAQWTRRTVF